MNKLKWVLSGILLLYLVPSFFGLTSPIIIAFELFGIAGQSPMAPGYEMPINTGFDFSLTEFIRGLISTVN